VSGLVALALILSVLVFGVAMILFYEFAAVRRRDDDLETISSYWTRLHRGRLLFLVTLALALTGLYVFLIGDLVLELW
jgi:heme/copper-type cytochrome/quinol oxidase subunit 2